MEVHTEAVAMEITINILHQATTDMDHHLRTSTQLQPLTPDIVRTIIRQAIRDRKFFIYTK